MIGIANFASRRFNPVLQTDPIQDLLQEHSLLSIPKDKIHKLQEPLQPEIPLEDLFKMTFHPKAKNKITFFLQGRQELHIKINYKFKESRDQKPMKL